MPSVINKALLILSYALLIGPPRAVEIKSRANGKDHELQKQPLFIVLIAELGLRAGMFLVLASLVESVLGDQIFEDLKVDMVFLFFIIGGIIHSLFYYVAFGLMSSTSTFGKTLYRIGRNAAYSVVVAILAALGALFWQEVNDITLFKGDLVEHAFVLAYFGSLLVGFIEALFVKRCPVGLGSELSKRYTSNH